jgi:acetyl-CoA carboxylase biotin carboxyl carrier protein
MLRLDPEAAGVGTALSGGEDLGLSAGALAFKAPSSGRFYARPSPDKPPFVTEGAVIEQGHTVAILEVMKTFNRIAYGGAGLPERAKVVRVVPADGDDLGRGDVILELEPA